MSEGILRLLMLISLLSVNHVPIYSVLQTIPPNIQILILKCQQNLITLCDTASKYTLSLSAYNSLNTLSVEHVYMFSVHISSLYSIMTIAYII